MFFLRHYVFCMFFNLNLFVEENYTLHEKCTYSELFWSTFSRIRTESGEILYISPHSVRMRENVDQNNSKYGHFSRSDMYSLLPFGNI